MSQLSYLMTLTLRMPRGASWAQGTDSVPMVPKCPTYPATWGTLYIGSQR